MNINLINKLWERTVLIDGHWIWCGPINDDGYGTVSYNNTDWRVHRLSLCIYLKLLYKNNWVACHINSICEYKNCWNPLHLYQGDYKDNVKDTIANGNHRSNYELSKTICINGHGYTKENTYIYPSGKRQCRICRKINKENFDRKARSKRKPLK